MQADAIQDFLRSSEEPPDSPTRARNRANLRKFLDTIKAKSILHEQLTKYMWDSQIAQSKQDKRKSRRQTQIQKGGVVYAGDVSRGLTKLDGLMDQGAALNSDQQIYLIILRSMVLPETGVLRSGQQSKLT